jgi:hypothetical protein
MNRTRRDCAQYVCQCSYARCPGTGRMVAPRVGMTLLELMLALTLSAVVLTAISMAIDLHLRVLQSRRDHVERIQLARAVLTIIATDLRATVQQNTTDFSSLASMASEALSSDAATDVSGGTGSDGGTGGTGGASSGTGTGGTGTGTGPGTGPGTGAGTGTGPGTGPGTGAGTGAGTGGAAGSTSEDTAAGDSTSTSQTQDIASSGTVPPVPGLYGNQYELQVDVSRLPRVDEFQRMTADNRVTSLQDIPSDVKTVAYYCVRADSVASSGVVNRRTGRAESGLVRRVMDRAVTLYASQNGNLQGLEQVAEVVAPEVMSIEFQYFDGTEWLTEWDSEELQGLPVAVKITLLLAPSATALDADTGRVNRTSASTRIQTQQVYSLTVRLPTAKPAASDTTTDSSGMEAVGL